MEVGGSLLYFFPNKIEIVQFPPLYPLIVFFFAVDDDSDESSGSKLSKSLSNTDKKLSLTKDSSNNNSDIMVKAHSIS